MDLVKIDLGAMPSGAGGDSRRTAFIKINDNFEEVAKNLEDSEKLEETKIDKTSISNAIDSEAEDTIASSLAVASLNSKLTTLNNQKVEKEEGKGLSANDFTDMDKQRLDQCAESGENHSITQLTGLTTPLGIHQGGTNAQNIEDARRNLGLGEAATRQVSGGGRVLAATDVSNTFSSRQTFQAPANGEILIEMRNTSTWPNPPDWTNLRGPLVRSTCPNWGEGTVAEFFVEEVSGYSSQAVIGLRNWAGNYNWWQFRADGNGYAPGAWISSSDKRLKSDFKEIGEEKILEQAKTFRGYTFTRLRTGKREAGFKAQDIQKVLPEAVFVNQDISLPDGTTVEQSLGLDYGAMSAYNHECILALLGKVEKLESQLAEYKARVELLEAQSAKDA